MFHELSIMHLFLLVFSAGISVVLSRHRTRGGVTYGVATTIGYDPLPVSAGFNINRGATLRNFKELKENLYDAFYK